MAYVRERRVYRLAFADDDMNGLEVRARSVPLGQFFHLAKLLSKGLTLGDVDQVSELFSGFADALVDWNLENEDGPVPATLDGLYAQDIDFVLPVIEAWIDAVGGGPNPNPRRPGGATDGRMEASLPVEPLTAPLVSVP